MVRTLFDALELVRVNQLVTEVPASGVVSLAESVAGGKLQGSWRTHAKGRLIYRLGRMLRASPDVLTLRWVEGKATFLDPRLWPAAFRVVSEPVRRRASLLGLSEEARALLTRVERERRVRIPKDGPLTKAREVLELRLLVHSGEEPDEAAAKGHVAVLTSWREWGSAWVQEAAAALSYDEAIARLGRPALY